MFPVRYLYGHYIGNQYQGSTQPIWMDNVECNGDERDVNECKHAGWGNTHSCGHEDDVAISCEVTDHTVIFAAGNADCACNRNPF